MSHKDLDREIERAKREAKPLVDERVRSFLEKRDSDWRDWFSELCFCLLTANSTATMGIRIQEALGFEGFYNLPVSELEGELRRLGYRFPRTRASYIVGARPLARTIRERVSSIIEESGIESARDWLVERVKGLGMKEASHFLRNTGFFGVAIVDRHVLRVLVEHGLYHLEGSLTRKRYLEAERVIIGLGERHGLEPGVLDLYLWYIATGRVLK